MTDWRKQGASERIEHLVSEMERQIAQLEKAPDCDAGIVTHANLHVTVGELEEVRRGSLPKDARVLLDHSLNTAFYPRVKYIDGLVKARCYQDTPCARRVATVEKEAAETERAAYRIVLRHLREGDCQRAFDALQLTMAQAGRLNAARLIKEGSADLPHIRWRRIERVFENYCLRGGKEGVIPGKVIPRGKLLEVDGPPRRRRRRRRGW